MRTLNALRKLFVKLGGDESDVSGIGSNAAMIDKIADVASGGGGGAGGGVMFVTFTGGDSYPPQYTADKTFDEITNAVNNNQMIVGINNYTNSYVIFNYTGKEHIPDDTECHVFNNIAMYKEDGKTIAESIAIRIWNDNTITFVAEQIEQAAVIG